MKKYLSLVLLAFVFSSQVIFAQKTDEKQTKWVDETLKILNLREKIGQMVMVRMSGEFMNFNDPRFLEVRRHIEEDKLGGFIVFRGDVNAIANLTNEAQRISKIPLLFAADYERGLRMQMKNGTPFTTNMGLGATNNPEAAYRQGKIIAEEMRSIGVNWLFAPVADVNNNPDNPVINIRSFGENPEKVAEFAAALSRGAKAGGALATLKHFPGHGDTATDSHIGLSVVQVDKQRLENLELVAFRKAIKEGVDSVMTAHVAMPKITGDEVPATINPKVSTDILRKELGFNGIITTDAMEMGAIRKNYEDDKSVVMAVQAGADLILLPNDATKAIDAVEKAVKAGQITEERINESVRRLLKAKYELGLPENRFVDPTKVNQLVEKPENVREANETTEKSITLLRNKNGMFPLKPEKAANTLFIVVAADDDPNEGIAFIPEIQRRLPNAKIIRIDPRTSKEEYANSLTEAQKFDAIVLAPFVKRAAAKGTVALPDVQTAFVKQILALNGKNVGVIAFGSPYLIRQFPEVQVYAVTYAIEDIAQNASVKTLFGEVPFRGKLPVRIPDLFEIGSGITK